MNLLAPTLIQQQYHHYSAQPHTTPTEQAESVSVYTLLPATLVSSCPHHWWQNPVHWVISRCYKWSLCDPDIDVCTRRWLANVLSLCHCLRRGTPLLRGWLGHVHSQCVLIIEQKELFFFLFIWRCRLGAWLNKEVVCKPWGMRGRLRHVQGSVFGFLAVVERVPCSPSICLYRKKKKF